MDARDVRLQNRETGLGPHLLFGSSVFRYVQMFAVDKFSNLRLTATLHYFRWLELYKNERSRIETRTFGIKFDQNLACRRPALVSLTNDGSVKRWTYFGHMGKGKSTYMNAPIDLYSHIDEQDARSENDIESVWS